MLYTAVGAVIAGGLLISLGLAIFSKPSSCFNRAQDGDERGVDCGGSCALICPFDARAPVVLWTRVFQVAPGFYTAAAYVENHNVGAGAKNVRYSFKLYDERGILVKEQIGVINIPPISVIPIIEPSINVGNRTVASASFAFGDEEILWTKNTHEIPTLRITQPKPSSDFSRLSATIANDSLEDVHNLTLTAVLFDRQGVARAASKSAIPLLARRSSQDVVFTWGSGVPNIVRAEITLLPAF